MACDTPPYITTANLTSFVGRYGGRFSMPAPSVITVLDVHLIAINAPITVWNWHTADGTATSAPCGGATARLDSLVPHRSLNGVEHPPCLWPHDAVGHEAMGPLELPDSDLRVDLEDAAFRNLELALDLPHELALHPTAQRDPARLRSGRGRWLDGRDQRGRRREPGDDAGHGRSKRVHVEARIVLPAGRQRILLVTATEVRALSDVLQDRGDAPPIRVDLHIGPRVIGESRVLRLDADEAAVAGADVLPHPRPCVVAAPRGDHVIRPIATQTQLRERPGKIGPAVDQRAETRHVADLRSGGVVADDAFDPPHLRPAPTLPAIHQRDLQAGVLQHRREPRQRIDHRWIPPSAAGRSRSFVSSVTATSHPSTLFSAAMTPGAAPPSRTSKSAVLTSFRSLPAGMSVTFTFPGFAVTGTLTVTSRSAQSAPAMSAGTSPNDTVPFAVPKPVPEIFTRSPGRPEPGSNVTGPGGGVGPPAALELAAAPAVAA